MDFHIDITDLIEGLERLSEKFHSGTEIYGKTAALKMESYAKKNAPWHNRTGNARNTITGFSGWGYTNIEVTLKNVGKSNAYGEFMEVANIDIPTSVGYGNTFVIGVSGNMEYSKYLEYAHGGTYAIMQPTVNATQAEIIRGWASMLNKLK